MASINGITVKALKSFRGHEGEHLCQGNVYLGNKKIGWWSQNSHGGCDHIYLDEPYRVDKLSEKVKELNHDKVKTYSHNDGSQFTVEYSLDLLFGDLMVLIDDEAAFKKAVIDGYTGILLVTDGHTVFGWNLRASLTNMSNMEIIEYLAKDIEEGKKQHGFYKEDKFIKHKIKIYRSLDDFNIGEKINLTEIKGGK